MSEKCKHGFRNCSIDSVKPDCFFCWAEKQPSYKIDPSACVGLKEESKKETQLDRIENLLNIVAKHLGIR